jgi:hypothetical protein
MLTAASEALKTALVAAFGPYLRTKIGGLGMEVSDQLEGVIADCERRLSDELDALLSLPFEAQRRGPLEVFQATMSAPTAYLGEQGCEPVTRDPVAVNALPGDIFDLAPASSAALGEDVWMSHLAWGAEKAASLRGRIG